MKTKYSILLILWVQLALTGCVPDKYPGIALVIDNHTPERIYYWYSRADYEIHHYPDISLPHILPVDVFSVGPNNSQIASGTDPDWESIFNQLPEGKLTVYFFSFSPETQEEWTEVVENMDTIGRKDVTLEELKSNDYRIAFP